MKPYKCLAALLLVSVGLRADLVNNPSFVQVGLQGFVSTLDPISPSGGQSENLKDSGSAAIANTYETDFGSGSFSATAEVSKDPIPGFSATVSTASMSGPPGLYAASSMGGVEGYYFKVSGPDALIPVKVSSMAHAGGEGSEGSTGAATASLNVWNITTGGEVVFDETISLNYSLETLQPSSLVLDVDETLNLNAGDIYLIRMAMAISTTSENSSATMTGSILSTVNLDIFDPAYSIEFSPGVGNGETSQVPEFGGTLLMLLLGFVSLVLSKLSARRA